MLFFSKDGFGVKLSMKADLPLNKANKHFQCKRVFGEHI